MTTIISVVGARPQFVKLAPIAQAAKQSGVNHIIIHTGQHYDANMSDVFFDDLAIPAPDYHLAVGSANHGAQTGAMLAQLEEKFLEINPDWVLVYGDTNSTLAAALAAVKLHIPVAHLEAGLRSFNREMPEEHNRVLTDHAADLLLPPTQVALEHLQHEGLGERSVVVGDVMTDVCYQVRDAVKAKKINLDSLELPDGPFVVATLHRPANTDDPEKLAAVLASLSKLPIKVLLLAHPRLKARCTEAGIDISQSNKIIVHDPLPYPQMVAAVMASSGVVTDSGGLQKEAFLLERLCTTLRTETEWVETLVDGWNVLVPDVTAVDLSQLVTRETPETVDSAPYGTGQAAVASIQTILQWQDR